MIHGLLLMQRLKIIARPLVLQRKLLSTSVRVCAAHGGNNNHDDSYVESKLHPDKFLKAAREWPTEYHAPGNYVPIGEEHEPETYNTLGHNAETVTGEETSTPGHEHFSLQALLLGSLFLGTGIYFAIQPPKPTGFEDHPITKYWRERMTTEEHILEENRIAIKYAKYDADNRLISQHNFKTPHRFKFREQFDRTSDHLIEPGTQADVSNFDFKYSWQKNDAISGVPFPNVSE
ncbi:hypothetical protein HK096_011523 [Nowakowskiella sp. JEL0078]|nr:hypothetical protein HK096_011523 [Nowakowskiella sp. JEL0078]